MARRLTTSLLLDSLGMNDLSLFCTDDLYDGNNMVQVRPHRVSMPPLSRQSLAHNDCHVQVMFCIQDFMRFSQEHSGHFLHPVFDDHVTFSNQEVRDSLYVSLRSLALVQLAHIRFIGRDGAVQDRESGHGRQ